MYMLNITIANAIIIYFISITNLKLYVVGNSISFINFKTTLTPKYDINPPIIIPIIPITVASINTIFNTCVSVAPILFSMAYSFFLSFIVIRNALYNIIINIAEKTNITNTIIISIIYEKFSVVL